VRREPIAHAAVLSGVELDEAYARTASRRAEFLRSRAAEVPLLYFTSNTYLMPALSGIYCDLPFADPYVESFDMIDFEHSVASILEKRPAELLFDDPASGFVGSKERQIFIARLKSRLAPSYRMSGATAGWEIWKRAA